MTREEAKKVFEYLEKKANTQEPCTDTVSIRKDILKCRVGNIVAYNVEWLKKNWQMEMDIVCGVKPCDDAISRDAVIEIICRETEWYDIRTQINELPSVTQKSGKWIDYDSLDDTIARLNKEGWEITRYEYKRIQGVLFEMANNCGAKMVEPQESKDIGSEAALIIHEEIINKYK